jgi:flagellar biosynthesis/type III secretory pathway protein FliH
MLDGFVPLDLFLKPSSAPPQPQSPVPAAPQTAVPEELETTLRAARRFRAALSDALDAALPSLLQAIANDVLARELRLEPADVASIVASALDRAAGEHAVAIRVHPTDHDAVASLEVTTIADAALTPGDCRIELRSGTIESSLQLRLQTVLAAHTA